MIDKMIVKLYEFKVIKFIKTNKFIKIMKILKRYEYNLNIFNPSFTIDIKVKRYREPI